MDRRSFLKGAAAVLAGAAAGSISYFDLGPSWAKHDQLWIPQPWKVGDIVRIGGIGGVPTRTFAIRRAHFSEGMDPLFELELNPVPMRMRMKDEWIIKPADLALEWHHD